MNNMQQSRTRQDSGPDNFCEETVNMMNGL